MSRHRGGDCSLVHSLQATWDGQVGQCGTHSSNVETYTGTNGLLAYRIPALLVPCSKDPHVSGRVRGCKPLRTLTDVSHCLAQGI